MPTDDLKYTTTFDGNNQVSIKLDLDTFQVFEILADELCAEEFPGRFFGQAGYDDASLCQDLARSLQERLDDGRIDAYIEAKAYLPELRARHEETARAIATKLVGAKELPDGTLEGGEVLPLSEEETQDRIRRLDDELNAGKYSIERKDIEALIAFFNASGGIKPRRDITLKE
jgi:hypothetical protein